LIRPKWEVSDVLKMVSKQLREQKTLPNHVLKTAQDIIQCRTHILGGHKLKCSHCQYSQISYNSCRNRHCPKCQYSKQEQWILDRKAEILPTPYFHVVFTIPHTISKLAKAYPKEVYGIMFKAAWKTVKTLSNDSKWLGAKTGMIAVLHTWGQNLSFHPHLHCIIPQGGWLKEVRRWIYSNHRNFLFPVRVMSALYKRYFIELLDENYSHGLIGWETKEWLKLRSCLESSSFNVFVKRPFSGPKMVVDYLGRYTHRVAITNHRIVDVNHSGVAFKYKDYRDGNNKILKLTLEEFARRFLQHVLPKGFAKIRHYGILSNKAKKIHITNILLFFERRKASKTKFDPISHILEKYGVNLLICPLCKTGKLHRKLEIPPNKDDPLFVFSHNYIRSNYSNITVVN